MDAQHLIASPDPQQKASTTSHIDAQMNADKRTNKQANIQPLLTPRVIACGACGHLPLTIKYYLAAWTTLYGFPVSS